MKTLRIFISSPGDVRLERVRAFDVVSRLQTKFRAFLKLDPILWEHDAQSGWATFQANIVPPSKTDIVICILWARIGMRLPEDYKRPDGSVPTGTEWEFEDAFASYKLNGTPDLYVYRKTARPTIEVTSDESLEEWRRQKRALDLFFERWFRDHDGAFKAGFNTFQSDEEFGRMLEQHLEKVINQRIQQEEGYSAEEERKITWFEGSPFRGLSAFQPEHAPVFYGRDLEIREITDRLVAQSGAGKVFLMILGMSGCGKSSLARAGVLPALLQPGAVAAVDCWRWLILRPGEALTDLTGALAEGLLSPQALPELETLGYSAHQLSALLSEAPAHVIPPLDAALRQAGRQVGAERKLSGTQTCRLLVIVDQLEEMFTLERIDSAQRQQFVTALGALCRSGLVWIVTTMRSDLYARCGEVEELLTLKGQDGQYDLRPPGFAEVGQMIRLPAKAAGLRFELEPESGKTLDDALHEEAWKNPEALPLLEFTLEELYRAKGESNLLSWRAYRSLGGMQGAIARRAEEVYESLSAEGKAALASVFSLLVLIPEREAATGKPAPLEELKRRSGAEEVVNSFAKASLLLSDVDAHGTRVVSLAHEALLTSWPRLQEWLRQNYEFLKVRERVAAAGQRWIDEQRADPYLLAEGKPLVEAKELLNRHRETLSGKEIEFICASIGTERIRRKRETERRRKVLIVISLALVVAIIFGVVSFWQYQKATVAALNEKKAAEAANNARDQADGLINFMMVDLRDRLFPIGRLSILDAVVKKVQEYLQHLPKDAITNARLFQQAVAFGNVGDVLVSQGKLEEAFKSYQQTLEIMKKLAGQEPSNAVWQRNLSLSYGRVGDVLASQGKLDEAVKLYQESLEIRKKLAEQDPSNAGWQSDLSIGYKNDGDVLLSQGKEDEALKCYQQSLEIDKKLAEQHPSNAGLQYGLSASYVRVGSVLVSRGKQNEALKYYQQALEIKKKFAGQDPSDAEWESALSFNYKKVGDILLSQGRREEALNAFKQALEVSKKLADQDPSNAGWQRDLSSSYQEIGDVLLSQGKQEEALNAFQQALEIDKKLTGQDQSNAGWQYALSVNYARVGDVMRSQGKQDEALKFYQQALEIKKKIVAQDPSNAEWEYALSINYARVGDVLVSQGKQEEALKFYQQALEIKKKLTSQDPSNAAWQYALSVSYARVGDVMMSQGKLDEALKFYQQALEIKKKFAGQNPSDTGWQYALSINYKKVGGALLSQGKREEALNAFQQALEVSKKLAEKDSSNAGWQRDLIMSYYNLGNVLTQSPGNLDEGKSLIQKALELATSYSGADRTQLIQSLTTALNKLAPENHE